jgi:hypothetical protein
MTLFGLGPNRDTGSKCAGRSLVLDSVLMAPRSNFRKNVEDDKRLYEARLNTDNALGR